MFLIKQLGDSQSSSYLCNRVPYQYDLIDYMKAVERIIITFLLFLSCQPMTGQGTDSIADKIFNHLETIGNFAQNLPQEEVYLHFDNTSYYQGDKIWFKCYVVTSALRQATQLSKTLYVELLNPGGEIIGKQILKIENGQCHGDFTLNRLPFYSGFYEVRAYTKYMLNFGDDIIFSRLLPVFDKPKEEGDYKERKMLPYNYGKFPMKRVKPQKDKKVNLRFFPEGGSLVKGITSQVAFEATDAYGNPIAISGTVINEKKEEVTHFSTLHDGRGVFTYTPTEDEKQKAIVNYKGKSYKFDMPIASSQGFVLKVDNLSSTDSIDVTIRKSKVTPASKLGIVVLCRGVMYHSFLINATKDRDIHIKINKSTLPSGVSRVVMFDSNGNALSSRSFFHTTHETLEIKAKTGKTIYDPYEPVDMSFSVTDANQTPIQIPFSLAVRDGENEIGSSQNILTSLLLSSETKGYIHNPSYYFEADDSTHRAALDQLLMVQGWQRYSWDLLSGTLPFQLKYLPEQGIVTEGKVISFVREKPKPNIEVSSFLMKRGENEQAANLMGAIVTDSLGRFSFISDLQGQWEMILSVTKGGKKKDYRIILDRVFSPKPQKYRYAEMQLDIANTKEDTIDSQQPETPEEDIEKFFTDYADSLSKTGKHEKINRLKEVVVTAKKNIREKDIFNSRSKSVAYYDVRSEVDNITDSGEYIGDDIHGLLLSINRNFTLRRLPDGEYLDYKNKHALFVVNYERTLQTELDYNKYKLIRLDAIKSIYINENLSTICQYADPALSPMDVDDLYRCAVFIETYPEGKIPAEPGKGVRKTKLEGYSKVEEFYHPDYSVLPTSDPDYRRTLYWNPSVMPDKDGKANVRFYNNSRCRKFSISAETITPQGVIGIYKESQ